LCIAAEAFFREKEFEYPMYCFRQVFHISRICILLLLWYNS
jgi:hypothetical protein